MIDTVVRTIAADLLVRAVKTEDQNLLALYWDLVFLHKLESPERMNLASNATAYSSTRRRRHLAS